MELSHLVSITQSKNKEDHKGTGHRSTLVILPAYIRIFSIHTYASTKAEGRETILQLYDAIKIRYLELLNITAICRLPQIVTLKPYLLYPLYLLYIFLLMLLLRGYIGSGLWLGALYISPDRIYTYIVCYTKPFILMDGLSSLRSLEYYADIVT